MAAIAPREATRLDFPSGYVVKGSRDVAGERLTVFAPSGVACLEIVLTENGPVATLRGIALQITTSGPLHLGCRQLSIEAEEDIRIRAGRHLVQSAEGDLSLRAGGTLASEAHAQSIYARLGDVRIKANDDVSLDGERIRLNSPVPVAAATAAGPGSKTSLDPSKLELP